MHSRLALRLGRLVVGNVLSQGFWGALRKPPANSNKWWETAIHAHLVALISQPVLELDVLIPNKKSNDKRSNMIPRHCIKGETNVSNSVR